MNTSASWPDLNEARARVSEMQTKLHRWARADATRRFDDLYNLVCDPAFLTVAWDRVSHNRGARTAGADQHTVRDIQARVGGVDAYLHELRDRLRSRTFRPLPVRERQIPKPGTGKSRRLGIPTVTDRVVQASLKLVLEPIFEATFQPCSYGFRPKRRAHDAIAEVHLFCTSGYTQVLDADIQACFDEIDHTALMDRTRRRVEDRRVLALVKAFLKAGILSEDQFIRDTLTGTPQGGILSPLLANIALSVLDDHFAGIWQRDMATQNDRRRRRRHGKANYRLVRYADDFLVLVDGQHEHVEALRHDVQQVLTQVGLRLSPAKTRVTHIDEGIDFLGVRLRRHRQWGSQRWFVYTYPSKKALASIKRKVKTISRQARHQPLAHLLRRLSAALRGWTTYFHHYSSKSTFQYVAHYTFWRVIAWIRRKHRRIGWKQLRRRYFATAKWPTDGNERLFDPGAVVIQRYRYRGQKIPTPWPQATQL